MPRNYNPECIRWKEIPVKGSKPYYRGYLGKVPVCVLQWHSHAEDAAWAVDFWLSGIQTPQSADSVEAGKLIANAEVSAWLDAANLEVADVEENHA